ncbi:MAG: sugar phosphate isomerase/epimerase [Granulosicoccus sp.]|nr:sugar phosphate isomerase/epimerase [Granulosicoccus sp.]
MSYPIGNAPCSWGVEFGDDPRNPQWQSVLDDARTAGYNGMELGPLGYLPEDPVELTDAMQSRGLTLTAAVLFRPLHDANKWDEILDATHRTCKSLQTLGAEQFVIIDSIAEHRVATAGRPDEAPRLDPADWQSMMDRLKKVCEIATGDYGMRASLHAHAAGCIEFEDEIDRVMEAIPASLIGLCIDTGHCEYARTDPVALYHRYHERTPYIHFKDVDNTIREHVVKERIGFYDACGAGLFCNLGDGVVDFNGFRDALAEHGYQGWATVEQDCDPSAGNPVIDDARANYDFLRSVGLASIEGGAA